jgi:hypothetical protein
MAYYATRENIHREIIHTTLVEISRKEMLHLKENDSLPGDTKHYYKLCTSEKARFMVKNGWHHETALYVNDMGKVVRASEGI